jgi:hypothetical protein
LSLELDPLSADDDVLAGVDEEVEAPALSPLLPSPPDFSALDFELEPASDEDFFA